MTVPVKKTLQTYYITHASRYDQQIGVAGKYSRHSIVSRIQDGHHLFKVKQENEYRFKKIIAFNVYYIVFSDTPGAVASTVQSTAP